MAMAQALSEEEFHRMQAQLLELRTQNYQLSDDLRKNSAELTGLRQKTQVLERDFGKVQKALSKSKKAQEVEALLGETSMLQGKLHSQEEDFRLQNSTLMTELSKLCTQIEQLEQDNQRLKESSSACRQKTPPCRRKWLPCRSRSEKSVEKVVGMQAGWSALCPLTPCFGAELEVALNTEQEEKRLLRQHIHTLEEDVYKKKQESFQHLQGEKEVLYNDSRTKIDEINQKKEEELNSMNLRIHKLQTDLMTANLTLQSKEKEHELSLHTLRDQAASQSAVSQEQVEIILQESDALRTNLAALEQQQAALSVELQQRREEQEALLAQRDDLTSQIQVMLDDVATQLNQEKCGHKEALSDLKLQHEKEVNTARPHP
ncbi:hypothetical protein NHX12_034193 [Muraenolepis orangiensis]|uniref:GRIP1-associated protein 1 n=1 Tax=Muraenolepis orangiensis TaxID=630683 RepID=A0A9Q0DA20_9TELE|nr:hypothetical protein NHX12_034193 [Muraenolepis orangiensis]